MIRSAGRAGVCRVACARPRRWLSVPSSSPPEHDGSARSRWSTGSTATSSVTAEPTGSASMRVLGRRPARMAPVLTALLGHGNPAGQCDGRCARVELACGCKLISSICNGVIGTRAERPAPDRGNTLAAARHCGHPSRPPSASAATRPSSSHAPSSLPSAGPYFVIEPWRQHVPLRLPVTRRSDRPAEELPATRGRVKIVGAFAPSGRISDETPTLGR